MEKRSAVSVVLIIRGGEGADRIEGANISVARLQSKQADGER